MPQKSNSEPLFWQKTSDFRPLIRMIGTSIEGGRTLYFGLSSIRGVGIRLALATCQIAGFDPLMRIGLLTDAQLEKIEKIIKDPLSFGIPKWMLNRQKDRRTGEYRHVSGNDLDLVLKNDLDRMKRIRSYKGIRHMFNLKCRGQHTRTTGRKGLTIGYMRLKGKKKTSAGATPTATTTTTAPTPPLPK